MTSYANTCPKCGGTANTHLIDKDRHKFYLCTRPVRQLQVNVKEKTVQFQPFTRFCNTMLDRFGKVFHGWVRYWDSTAKAGKGDWIAEKF